MLFEIDLKSHISNCLSFLKEMKKPKISLIPQTLCREDYAGLSAAHCQSNNETSEFSDLTKTLLMKAYDIPRQLQGPPIVSSSIFTHSTGLVDAFPLSILDRSPISLRPQNGFRSSTIATPLPDQMLIRQQQSHRSVPNSCNEMLSQKCEKNFKAVVFHWEWLGLDECFVKGSQM